MKTNFYSEAIKVLEIWKLSEFDCLIGLHGIDLFQFALRLSIQEIAPNPLDSFTRDNLVKRLYHYYRDVQTLHGLRLEHELGL